MLIKNRLVNHCMVVSALMFAAAAVPAEETTSSQNQRVRVADFSGKPPFSRRYAPADSAKTTDFARFEEVTSAESSKKGEKVPVADYRGRPPYRRGPVNLDGSTPAEFARFEEVAILGGKRRSLGPPGKGFRRFR